MEKIKIGFCGINVRKWLTAGLPFDVESYNQQCGNKTMLTADMYNKAVVVAMSLMELPVSDDQIARINEGT